MSSLVASS